MGTPVTAAALAGASAESTRWNRAIADLSAFIAA